MEQKIYQGKIEDQANKTNILYEKIINYKNK